MSDIRSVKSRRINKNTILKVKDLEDNKDISESVKSMQETPKKVKARKIKMSFTAKEEEKIDHQMEKEENISIAVMLIILVFCFIIGMSLGYMLYRIAINSSAMFIVRSLFSLHT